MAKLQRAKRYRPRGVVRSDELDFVRAPTRTRDTFLCPCCASKTLKGRGHFELCSVCFWEDYGYGDAAMADAEVAEDLRRARQNFRKFGASEARWREHVAPASAFATGSKNRIVTVNDTMQRGYRYELVAPMGRGFDPEFTPDLTPKEMLALGVFGGKYMRDCKSEFPPNWFTKAKLAKKHRDPKLNFFGVDASQPLSAWRKKGWIDERDPRGWFQWYCRYYMGRRIDDDARQIKRWKAIRRHVRQVEQNCDAFDFSCRPRQRQALLHWAYDSRKI
jgi:hypothetical protein